MKHLTTDHPFEQNHSDYLAIASLFYADFSIDWIQALTGSKASSIIAALEKGLSQGLLVRRNNGFYCFTDNTKKEALLASLKTETKKRYHAMAADVLLGDISYDNKDHIISLAHHLLEIDNSMETCRLLVRAGEIYSSNYSSEEAFRCYEKSISDLEQLDNPEACRLFVDTSIKYSKISTVYCDTFQILSVLKKALAKAQSGNMVSYQPILLMHLAKTEWLRSNYNEALKHFEKGQKLAEKINNPLLKRQAKIFSAFFLYWQGRYREAVFSYEQSVADIDQFPEGTFPILASITVGYCYTQIGQTSQGLGMLHSIHRHCLEKGNDNLASIASYGIGAALLNLKKTDEALEHFKISFKEAQKRRNEYSMMLGSSCLAYIYFLKNNRKRSLYYLRNFLSHSKRRQAMVLRDNIYLMELSHAMEQDKYPRFEELSLQSEMEKAIHDKNVFLKGVAYRYLAEMQIQAKSDHHVISAAFKKSLHWLNLSGQKVEIAKTRISLARHYLTLGNTYKAKEQITLAADNQTPELQSMVPDEFRPLLRNQNPEESLLENIFKLGREIVAINENSELLQHIITTVNYLIGAERGALFVCANNADKQQFRLKASKNITPEEIDHSGFLSSMNMINNVAVTGKALILGPDADAGEGCIEKIYSRICVPLTLKNELVGILYHDNRLLNRVFQESDLKLLTHFAAFAAFAIANAERTEQHNRIHSKLLAEKSYFEDQDLRNLRYENIIGESPAMKKVFSLIDQVAATNTTVLIEGETGVGKELIARAIFRQSPRQDKPFVRVHCNALTESLIPSELFGHEKGAFTGAIGRRIGRFELADEGTLFLDEIGELPPDIQVRLLRVLQTKEFERVGGSETIRSDFRLIVATNRNLKEEVAAGRFRADLYYRLNVFPIAIPPLRERLEDLQELIRHFVDIYASQRGKAFQGISEAHMNRMLKYNWPGNVRELENIIERAVILSKGSFIDIPELEGSSSNRHSLFPSPGPTLKDNERNHILWALQKTGGKIHGPGGAAELLEIHPSTLHSRMKKLNILRP